MDKYKSLISNTLMFAVATFSSKILTFLMMPILTRLMMPEDYSTSDLIVSTCNFLVPLISLCVHEAVIRFGLEKSNRKSDVFTTAVLTILVGYGILLLGMPLLTMFQRISGYYWLVYIYVLTSALRQTVTHFVRASGFTRIFALDGLLTTASTVGLVLLFVAWRGMGVTGYVLAIIIADAISALGLILLLRLYRFFKPRRLTKGIVGQMLRYSAPLMPTALFWWITNLSDRYLVDWLVGPAANGLYTAAYKIPTLITLVSTIFIQAWQISAFSEDEGEERTRFYSNVFNAYNTLVFLAASGLILLIKPITAVLVDESYYPSWQYVPFLVLAVAFSCLVTFLGIIYNVAKSNRMVTITTCLGAVINVGLNLLLIPKYGPSGAAFATFISYFIVFIIRSVDTRRYIAIRMHPGQIAVALVLLLVQVWAAMSEVRYWIPVEIGVFLLLLLVNRKSIVFFVTGLYHQFFHPPARE